MDSPDDLRERLARRGETLGRLQMLAKTFASLSLHDEAALLDTFVAQLGSILGAGRSFALRRHEGGLRLLCLQQTLESPGVPSADEILDQAAVPLWQSLLDERITRLVPADEVRARWPACPPWLDAPLVSVPVDLEDTPEALAVFTARPEGSPLDDDDREFLTTAAAVASMALASVRSHQAQQQLMVDLERKADEARSEAQARAQALNELDAKVAFIEQQRDQIRRLSAPVLRLWQGVLAVPVVGRLDADRGQDLLERLLTEVSSQRARHVVLDLTGLDEADPSVAEMLLRIAHATALLGSTCRTAGLRPALAQALAALGDDSSRLLASRDLHDALRAILPGLRIS